MLSHRAVPLVSLLSWLSIVVMTIMNPSRTVSVPALTAGHYAAFAITTAAAFALPILPVLRTGRGTRHGPGRTSAGRSAVYFALLAALLLMAILMGIAVHRDYYVYATQIIVLYLSRTLLSLDSLGTIRNRPTVYRALTVGALVAFTLWIVWLMMASYAIMTRVEPRWIESSVYNLINGMIGLVLLFSAGLLWEQAKRTVSCGADGIYLDGRNVTSLLTAQEAQIARVFLEQPDDGLTCAALHNLLRRDADDRSRRTDCETCMQEGWTAYNCSAYRNIKNRISDAKKYLELLQIGTIVPVSENTRDIKRHGWRLRLFDDVRNVCGRGRRDRGSSPSGSS